MKAPPADNQAVGALSSQVERGQPQSAPCPPQPGDFGLPPDVTFQVMRGGQASSRPVSWAEALDFFDACGINIHSLSGEVTLATIFAGVPFHIDGADMSFKPIQ